MTVKVFVDNYRCCMSKVLMSFIDDFYAAVKMTGFFVRHTASLKPNLFVSMKIFWLILKSYSNFQHYTECHKGVVILSDQVGLQLSASNIYHLFSLQNCCFFGILFIKLVLDCQHRCFSNVTMFNLFKNNCYLLKVYYLNIPECFCTAFICFLFRNALFSLNLFLHLIAHLRF